MRILMVALVLLTMLAFTASASALSLPSQLGILMGFPINFMNGLQFTPFTNNTTGTTILVSPSTTPTPNPTTANTVAKHDAPPAVPHVIYTPTPVATNTVTPTPTASPTVNQDMPAVTLAPQPPLQDDPEYDKYRQWVTSHWSAGTVMPRFQYVQYYEQDHPDEPKPWLNQS